MERARKQEVRQGEKKRIILPGLKQSPIPETTGNTM